MDIINGTDTRSRIILGFSRAEFDDLCEQLTANCFPTGVVGKILRLRSCFTDPEPDGDRTELFVKKIPFPTFESHTEREARTRADVDGIIRNACPAQCTEGHTYGSGCLLGPADVKAGPFIVVSQEDVGDWSLSGVRIPQPPVPTLEAMAELAAAVQAGYVADRLRLEHAITTSIEDAGLTIVRADPVEQVAAHPSSITRLRSAIEAELPSHELWGAGITRHSPCADDYLAPGRYADLPLVPDDTLPPGEVHLRPHPRPAGSQP